MNKLNYKELLLLILRAGMVVCMFKAVASTDIEQSTRFWVATCLYHLSIIELKLPKQEK